MLFMINSWLTNHHFLAQTTPDFPVLRPLAQAVELPVEEASSYLWVWLLGVVILLIVAVVFWLFFKKRSSPTIPKVSLRHAFIQWKKENHPPTRDHAGQLRLFFRRALRTRFDFLEEEFSVSDIRCGAEISEQECSRYQAMSDALDAWAFGRGSIDADKYKNVQESVTSLIEGVAD